MSQLIVQLYQKFVKKYNATIINRPKYLSNNKALGDDAFKHEL